MSYFYVSSFFRPARRKKNLHLELTQLPYAAAQRHVFCLRQRGTPTAYVLTLRRNVPFATKKALINKDESPWPPLGTKTLP
jgi:hypothetical protein